MPRRALTRSHRTRPCPTHRMATQRAGREGDRVHHHTIAGGQFWTVEKYVTEILLLLVGVGVTLVTGLKAYSGPFVRNKTDDYFQVFFNFFNMQRFKKIGD